MDLYAQVHTDLHESVSQDASIKAHENETSNRGSKRGLDEEDETADRKRIRVGVPELIREPGISRGKTLREEAIDAREFLVLEIKISDLREKAKNLDTEISAASAKNLKYTDVEVLEPVIREFEGFERGTVSLIAEKDRLDRDHLQALKNDALRLEQSSRTIKESIRKLLKAMMPTYVAMTLQISKTAKSYGKAVYSGDAFPGNRNLPNASAIEDLRSQLQTDHHMQKLRNLAFNFNLEQNVKVLDTVTRYSLQNLDSDAKEAAAQEKMWTEAATLVNLSALLKDRQRIKAQFELRRAPVDARDYWLDPKSYHGPKIERNAEGINTILGEVEQ